MQENKNAETMVLKMCKYLAKSRRACFHNASAGVSQNVTDRVHSGVKIDLVIISGRLSNRDFVIASPGSDHDLRHFVDVFFFWFIISFLLNRRQYLTQTNES